MQSIGEIGKEGRAFEENWFTDFAGDGSGSFATFSRSTLVIYPYLIQVQVIIGRPDLNQHHSHVHFPDKRASMRGLCCIWPTSPRTLGREDSYACNASAPAKYLVN